MVIYRLYDNEQQKARRVKSGYAYVTRFRVYNRIQYKYTIIPHMELLSWLRLAQVIIHCTYMCMHSNGYKNSPVVQQNCA